MVSTSLVYLNVNDFKLSMSCVPNNKGFNYKWEKKDGKIRASSRRIFSSNLTLVNLRPEDSGEYRCIVSNSTGRITSKYQKVIVIGM